MAPLPVPTSSTAARARRREQRASAASTSSSVSGRGISTSGDTRSGSEKNSWLAHEVRERLAARAARDASRRSARAAARARARSGNARNELRGCAVAYASSTSASSCGDALAPRALRTPRPPTARRPSRRERARGRRAMLALRHGSAREAQRAELIGLVLVRERPDHVVELAVDDVVELVEREVDAVIGEPALREVVGADALGAVAGADQAAALLGRLGLRASSPRRRAAAPTAATSRARGSCAASARPGTRRRCRSAGA